MSRCWRCGDGRRKRTLSSIASTRLTTSCGRRCEAKQKFGARSAEYGTACHRVKLCEEWNEACRAVDEKQGALKYEKERDAARRALDSAFAAFDKVKPTTTLGLFLTLLHGDEGDDFADEHPAAVDAIIGQLQAANVPLRSLAKAKKGGAA